MLLGSGSLISLALKMSFISTSSSLTRCINENLAIGSVGDCRVISIVALDVASVAGCILPEDLRKAHA